MYRAEDRGGKGRTANWARVGQATSELQLTLTFSFEVCCHWDKTVRRDPICFLGPHSAVLIHIHFSTTVENAAKMTDELNT